MISWVFQARRAFFILGHALGVLGSPGKLKSKVFIVGTMDFLQQLLLFLSITTVPTTKELSCSNWPPPVWINLCYSVTMEMIVMSQAAASLRGGWEAVPNIPLIASTLVINSWEHNRFQR